MKNLRRSGRHTWMMIGAFGAIWFVWGSTFLAGRIAVETIPPILLAALRSLAAGGLLYGALRLAGNRKRIAWRPSFIAGTLLFLGGHVALSARILLATLVTVAGVVLVVVPRRVREPSPAKALTRPETQGATP